MDFKNYLAWLTGIRKLIFHSNNFFGSGHFLIIFSELMDVGQPCKGIFEIHAHLCCIFIIFGWSFKWLAVIQEIKFLIENW